MATLPAGTGHECSGAENDVPWVGRKLPKRIIRSEVITWKLTTRTVGRFGWSTSHSHRYSACKQKHKNWYELMRGNTMHIQPQPCAKLLSLREVEGVGCRRPIQTSNSHRDCFREVAFPGCQQKNRRNSKLDSPQALEALFPNDIMLQLVGLFPERTPKKRHVAWFSKLQLEHGEGRKHSLEIMKQNGDEAVY